MNHGDKSFFLPHLMREWPALFYVCLLFIIGTILSAFVIGQSVTPFYVFQMYSQPILNADNGCINRFYINGKKFNTFTLYQERGDILRTNTDRFVYLYQNNFKDKYYHKLKEKSIGKYIPNIFYTDVLTIDKVSPKDYMEWLKSFLQKHYPYPIKNISIRSIKYAYTSERKLITIAEKEIIYASFK